MMNKWLRQFRFELGNIFRNPFLLSILALFVVLNLLSIGNISPDKDLFRTSYIYHYFYHTLTLGLVMFMGIVTVRRDVRRPSFEWASALPVSNGTKISAKYTAGMLYFTIFTLTAAIVYAVYSIQRGVASEITWEFTFYFAITYETSYIVTLALAMFLAIVISNRIVYLIGFCAWMFGTFFMEIFLIEKSGLRVLRTFHLSRLTSVEGQPNETWGFRLIAEELLYSRIFVISFALLLLIAGVTVLNRIRPTKHKLAVWVISWCALLLAGAAFVPYGQLWKERYAGYNAKLADPTLTTMDKLVPDWLSPDMYRIMNYDIELKKEEHDRLYFKVKLIVTAEELKEQTELKVTLNRSFEISETKVNGTQVSFSHEGEQVAIRLPELSDAAATLQVEMQYAGTMMDFAPVFRGTGSMFAFVKGESVFLPSYIAWYPLAGWQAIYVKEMDDSGIRLGSVFTRLSPNTAQFKLDVEGFERPLFTSLEEIEREEGWQQFEGIMIDGVSLFGGKFVELKDEDFPAKIVTTPYLVTRAQDILAKWKGLHQYFSGWIDSFEPRLEQLLMLTNDNYVRYSVENQTYVMTYSWNQDYTAYIMMNQMLLGSRRGDYMIQSTSDDVRLQIRSLMWYLYFWEQGYSDQDMYDGTVANYNLMHSLYSKDPDADPKLLRERMLNQVERALNEGQAEKVKEVLNYFYAKGIEIPDPDLDIASDQIPYSEWEQQWKKVFGDENSY